MSLELSKKAAAVKPSLTLAITAKAKEFPISLGRGGCHKNLNNYKLYKNKWL